MCVKVPLKALDMKKYYYKKHFYLISIIVVFLLSMASYALPAPSYLTAKADTSKNSVVLNWKPVEGASGYNVYRKDVTDLGYQRINFSTIKATSYEDKSVSRGKDYIYMIRSQDVAGQESVDSISAGAPLMAVSTKATVTTLREEPLSAKSIRTGKTVTFAAPGDIITYSISYANLGYGSAANIKIDYAIPAGTVIAGTPQVKKGPAVRIKYYDRIMEEWLDARGKNENISRVRFVVDGKVPPLETDNDVNGLIDLNVLIAL